MLSESQERMLLVASPEHEDRVRQIFTRWGLDAVAIGRVTADGKLRVFHGGKTVAEIPNRALSDEAPVYHRPLRRPEYLDRVQKLEEHALPAPDDWRQAVLRMMSSPNLCRKRWIWEQYDYMVRTNTVAGPGFDAVVLRLKESRRLLAMSTDCNPRYCYLDPINGARAAVAEACRNIVCSGGLPLAATNCLNFASPENPETMWQFSQTVDGLRDACRTFNTPITGGNVSFYNETNGVGIYPTPVVGMVGILESESRLTPSCFRRPGDLLILLGSEAVGLGGSEFLEVFHGRVEGIPVSVDLALEVRVQRFLSEIIGRGWVQSAHDCSEGGLLVTALESALAARPLLGFELSAGGDSYAHRAFFGEGPSRVLLSVTEDALDPLVSLANEQGILIKTCGRVTSGSIRVVYNGVELLSTKSDEVSCAWDRALERWKFGGEIR